MCYSLQWTLGNPTVNFKVLCNSCAKIAFVFPWVYIRLSLCGQQCPNCEWAIRLVYPLFLGELRLLSDPTKNVAYLTIQLDTHLYDPFSFLPWLILRRSKIINVSSWITLYVHM